MQHIHVKSESVKSVAWDSETSVLEIRFHNGSLYQYEGVPRETYNLLFTAESIGRYVNELIKPNYAARKVYEPAPASAAAAPEKDEEETP
jgi:KTSC domain